jgi:hypothetical protein
VGGGNGVVVCESMAVVTPPQQHGKMLQKKIDPSVEDNDDWGVTKEEENNVSMDDLEAKLAAMEPRQQQQQQQQPKQNSKCNPKKKKNTMDASTLSTFSGSSGLPIMPLASMQEPPACTVGADSRDVGLHGTSNQKIQDMLARYMQEEEDQEIVQMLQGKNTGTGAMEVDEDLTPEEMSLLRFSDRVKRAPQQVLRHAPGGEPLWSIPKPPMLSAGMFEFQILPSVLHVLKVDQHAAKSQLSQGSQLKDWYNAGGMDFGSIAIFSGPNSDATQQELVVIQDTAEKNDESYDAGAGGYLDDDDGDSDTGFINDA